MSPEEWLAAEFDRCKPWISAALDECPVKTHEIEHVWEALATGRAQLWPTKSSVVVTTIDLHPTGIKTVCAWLAGGDLTELKDTQLFLEEYGRKQGCAVFTIQGRRGWLRSLPGFRVVSTMVYKGLGG